jgi:lysophospholipase L1-like esterase
MKILAFGDSLTEGYVTKETPRYYPYTTTLKKLLSKQLGKAVVIHNKGVSGEKTGSMVKRIRRTCSKSRYDMAIILAGTNDLDDPHMSATAIANNVTNLHTYCMDKLGVTNVMCLSIPEVTSPNRTKSASITTTNNGDDRVIKYETKRIRVNKKLSSYCDQHIAVHYVHFGEVFKESQLGPRMFSGNGYHLSVSGYKKMAEFIANHIKTVLHQM